MSDSNANVLPLYGAPAELDQLDAPANFFNRELSMLHFNRRVLEQSVDHSIPLLERLKFLSICSSNLDEFFEVRVAGLRHRADRDEGAFGPDRSMPAELLEQVLSEARVLVTEQYRILNDVLIPSLHDEGIYLRAASNWNEEEHAWARTYFRKQIAPVITPISLDLTHPFPRLINKSLHFLLRIDGNDAFGRDLEYAVLHMPRSLPRLVKLPGNGSNDDTHRIALLSEIVSEFASELFPGMRIKGCYQFRLTRDSDLMLDEYEADDLASVLREELASRDFGASVRLEVGADCPKKVINFLLQKCSLSERDMFCVDGPVNLSRYIELLDLVPRPELHYDGFTPGNPFELDHGVSILDRIAERDYLLEHPYESFKPVVDLMREAASDPDVLAIQQTLYRTGSDSALIDALIDAARSGKEVTAVIEIRARFDEADNLALAQRLQDAGVLVVYGVVGFKTHAKMMLIVRREKKGKLRRYVHLGTGNYHMRNSRIYTDYSLLSANKPLGEDVQRVFQQLTGMGQVSELNLLWTSPFTLKNQFRVAIRNEVKLANEGKSGHIMVKVNALTDPVIIEEMYKASRAGVTIDLLVRGICALRPGVPGLSDNITVRSVVGRFLEHSRVYFFNNDGDYKLYCASADLMERNLDYRVEVCFPVLQDDLKARMREEMLSEYWQDEGLSWELQPNGEYVRRSATGEHKVQDRLLQALSK